MKTLRIRRAVSQLSTAKDTNVEFPKIKYFQTKKVNLAENVNQMIESEKAQKKIDLPEELKENNEYKSFIRDCKNPALGTTFIKNKYTKFYGKFFNIEKYQNRFNNNYSTKNLKDTMIAMKVKTDVDDSKYKNTGNMKFTQLSKTKLKWKTIKWLIVNKKENLEKLSNNKQILEKFNQIKKASQKGLNKKEFGELMISNNIFKDKDVINKLFWVFDEDGSGDIEYKELAFGLEMFRESSTENKLKSIKYIF